MGHGRTRLPVGDFDLGTERGQEVGDGLGTGAADHQRGLLAQRGYGSEDGDVGEVCLAGQLSEFAHDVRGG